MKKEIHIGRPYIVEKDGAAYLCATVVLHGESVPVWFVVEKSYGKYLVNDRVDAFVVGLLTTAMRDGTDIICDAPVTRRLLYQLKHYLIPILAANLPGFHAVSLVAEPADEKLPCEQAVATGWTGGVDCMFTLQQTMEREEAGHRLTHLMIADNGALEEEDNGAALEELIQKAKRGVAGEMGLSVVGIGTNLQELVPEKFLAVAAYRQAAVILAMQKLFGVYLSSSAYEFSRFSFDADNCFYYEMSLFPFLETDCTAFYSSGGAWSRVQKLKALSDFSPAQKYLHPCIRPLPEYNCGLCGKCVRTMTALYGLGTLERFSDVFDLGKFERDKDWYIASVLANKESQHYGEALVLMKARGIEPSADAIRKARIMCAAKRIAKQYFYL